MMSQKRGGIAITTVIELSMVILLAIAFINVTGILTDDEQLVSLYLARDLAQLTNTFESVGHDVSYSYPISFDQRNIILDGDLFSVVQDSQESIAGQVIVFTSAAFIPSGLILSPVKVTLDAAYFSMHKIGDAIIFKDGNLKSEDQEVLDDVLNKNTLSKKDIVVQVSFETKNYVEEELLSQLKGVIKSQLEDQGFETTLQEGNDKVIVDLIILFSDYEKNSVYYSSAFNTQSKPLSEEITSLLSPQQLDFNSHSFELGEQYSHATVKIQLSDTDKNMDMLLETKSSYKGTRLSLARGIAFGFTNYYSN